jgi:hypothetical protein
MDNKLSLEMCDRLKPGEAYEEAGDRDHANKKWSQSEKYLHDSGCFEANKALSKCMDENDRAWRAC